MLKLCRSIAILFTFFIIVPYGLWAQNNQKQIFSESPYGDYNDQSLPDWVREMYKPDANRYLVKKMYEDYYQSHPFKKNQHTQYYKRWVPATENFTGNDGKIEVLSRSQSDQQLQSYLDLRSDYESGRFGPNSQWTCIGPFDFDKDASGRSHAPGAAHVYTVEKSVSNPDFLVAGSANSGVYKTTDHGLNWVPITESLPIGECRAVEIQFDNTDVIYIGGNGRIYKTTDGGLNWSITGQSSFNSVSHKVYSIVMVPGNNQKLFASTNYGLYLTNDGGTNWNQVINCAGSGEYMGDIELKPNDTSVVYAIYNAKLVGGTNKYTELHKSINGGLTFSVVSGWPSNSSTITGTSHQRRAELAVTPAAPDRVYAILTGLANGGEGLYGVYRSDDAGQSWTHACCGTGPGGAASISNTNVMCYSTDGDEDGGQYYYDLAIAADEINADKVHVCGIMQWISTDGASTFTCANSWSDPSGDRYVHADIHDIHIYSNEVWIACDGGIFLSQDSGLTNFSRRQYGIRGTDFWGFGAGFKDGNVMLGGTYHNSHLLKNNNVYLNGWISYTGSADGYRGFVNPGDNKFVYNDSRKDKVPNLRTSPFTSYTFSKQPNASYFLGYSCPLVWDPRCYSTVYSGVDGALWKSYDDGISWVLIHNFGTGDITDLEIAFDNPDKIYLVYSPSAGARVIYKTIDGGQNWSNISIPSSVSNANTTRQIDLTIDEHQSDIVWAALLTSASASNGYKVFKTTDGGTIWSNYSTGTLDNHTIRSIVHQRGTDGGVYIGTDKTVFYRNNSLSDWQLYSNGLPALTASLKLVPWYKAGKIRNASNRSVWEAALYEPGSPKAQLMADKLNSGCLRDTFMLSDYSSQYGNGASWSWQITPAPSYHTPLNEENVKLVFGAVGTYSVSLVITDSMGTDSIGYTNLITVSNECESDTIPGYALHISNNGDFAACSEPFNLNSNQVTLSAWIKPDSIPPSWAGVIFCRGGSTTLGINFTGNAGQLGYHWDGGQWGWGGGPVINHNEWTHVALAVTPGSATLYVNGVAYTNTGTHDAEAFDAPLVLGNDPYGSARTFPGLIDEVCVYNRTLSQNEVRELMHLTRKPNADTTMICYLQFNEDSGFILDRSKLYHASLSGGASRTSSSAPVGGGVSKRVTVNGTGTYTFGTTGLSLNTATSGTNPSGEVCVTRINLQPDVCPSYPDSTSTCYWVLQNYGTIPDFDTLQSLILDRIGLNFGNCQNYHLYTRGPNADGPVWFGYTDEADACAGSFPNQSIQFSNGNSFHQAAQISLGSYPYMPTAAGGLSLLAYPLNDKSVAVKWNTYKESGTSYFIVERKDEGRGFKKIDSVRAAGFSAISLHYDIIDKNPYRGWNTYRIKLVNSNGSYIYSAEKQILFRSLPSPVTIGPNPIKSGEKINIYCKERQATYYITDALGHIVKEGAISDYEESVETNGMSSGSYQIIFRLNEQQYMQKLILY